MTISTSKLMSQQQSSAQNESMNSKENQQNLSMSQLNQSHVSKQEAKTDDSIQSPGMSTSQIRPKTCQTIRVGLQRQNTDLETQFLTQMQDFDTKLCEKQEKQKQLKSQISNKNEKQIQEKQQQLTIFNEVLSQRQTKISNSVQQSQDNEIKRYQQIQDMWKQQREQEMALEKERQEKLIKLFEGK